MDVSDTANINAGIKLGFDNSTPSSAKTGTMRYNAGIMQYCDGTSWMQLGGGVSKISGSDFDISKGSNDQHFDITATKPVGASNNAFPVITELNSVWTGNYYYMNHLKGYWIE